MIRNTYESYYGGTGLSISKSMIVHVYYISYIYVYRVYIEHVYVCIYIRVYIYIYMQCVDTRWYLRNPQPNIKHYFAIKTLNVFFITDVKQINSTKSLNLDRKVMYIYIHIQPYLFIQQKKVISINNVARYPCHYVD